MLFLMACHDVSIGNPCDAEFVLSEPSLYTYSLMKYTPHPCFQHGRPSMSITGPSSSITIWWQQLCRLVENLHEQNNTMKDGQIPEIIGLKPLGKPQVDYIQALMKDQIHAI